MTPNETIGDIDARLVADYLGGEQNALAGIYDRYADGLYDTARVMLGDRNDAADVTQDVFLVAAERLGQLRDPSRLKPWLFAILRNEVYRRTGKRRRTVATDFTEAAAEMKLPPDAAADASDAEYQELADLVRNAAAGLDARDQLVLELTIRQGLEGDDLAAALGVSAQQSYNLVHRMRQRAERSLGAFCVARRGRKDCPELATILADWDQQFSVLVRKRVARHIDNCEICERSRKKFVPLALFGAAPAFAAPPELRDRVLGTSTTVEPAYGFRRSDGFPHAVGFGRRLLLLGLLAGATALLVTAGLVFLLTGDDARTIATETEPIPTVTPTAAAAVTVANGTDPFGSTETTVTTRSEQRSTRSTRSTSTSSTSSTTSTSTSTTSTTTPPTTAGGLVVAPPTTDPDTNPPPPPPPGATTTTAAPAPNTTIEVSPPPPSSTTTTTTTTTTTATTVPPPDPPELTLSGGTVNFGPSSGTQREQLTLRNTGGTAVDWTSSLGPIGFQSGPFANSPTSGTLGPGASVAVTVTFDPSTLREGASASAPLTFTGGGQTAQATVTGSRVANPPKLTVVREPPACVSSKNALDGFPMSWFADVTDESIVVTTATVTPPNGKPTSTSVKGSGQWTLVINVGPVDTKGIDQPYQWTITAVDESGSRSGDKGTTTVKRAC